ncbi:serine/threonine-protein phosphatase 6 regulatory ankyrin repeat subunit B-like isoform X2 [Scylla paramamosain]|uniref:serine/threonine-protein phosphatase 6 regulatory ankyrin repeat subunit B-like isoform X2 n=1 Tax=Scylla paramamosain TaxID=85552 RepID=UPI0030829F6E
MASSPHHLMKEFLEAIKHQPTADLVTAVMEGDEAGVRSALDMGASPEVTVPRQEVSGSLLTLAASEGHEHLLSHLLQAGLSIEGGGTIDKTPLMMAAHNGHAHTVKALLELCCNPLAMDSEGMIALHFAAWEGHQQCVAALLPDTPPPPAHIEAYTPVHAASHRGHVEVLEQLADAGWPLTARDSDGNTPMHLAAAEDRVTCVQWLVQRGGDTSMKNNAGLTPLDQELVTAVMEGDEAGVRSAFDRGARPEITLPINDKESCSLLTLAASKGHEHLLSYLLQAGLSIEGGGTIDITPLMMAALNGHAHTVKALLDLRGNPLAIDSEGRTALHFAAMEGHQQCVAALLPVTPPTPAHLEADTPVHAASYRGHVKVLEQLADAGWPLTVRNSDGNTPMHRAAAGGRVTCVQWLVQRGGDTSMQNNAGLTPLDQELVTAVMEGDEAGMRSAFDRGARPEVTFPTNDGGSGSLLDLAASEGHEHLLSHLLQAGLSIEGGGNTDRTPLMIAAMHGHAHTVKALLDLRGNPLAMDSEGRTALHFAAMQGHQQCVAALLPVTPPTPAHLEAYTPVHAASYLGHVEVLEQLAGAGWPLTARNSDGHTPMHRAAFGGCAAAVQWLVQRGCDSHVQTKAGRTPLDFAVQFGHHEVESWLVKNCSGVVRRNTLNVQQVRELRGAHEHHHKTVLSMLVEGNEAAMANISKNYDGHALSQDGLTPLHAAALCGAPSDAVEALLRRGVSPHVTTPDNMTPADLARQHGQDSVIKGLQSHNCVQSYKLPEELHEELLSTVSRRDDVQAVSTLICKGAPIELLGGLSVLRLAVTTDRIHPVSLLLASGAPLPASLLQEAWQSPDVTHRVLATLTTAYCCRLRAEQRRLEKISSGLVEGIDNLVRTIEGNTPWQAAWRWGKETDRPALSDLLAKAAAANCPVTAAFLHRAGGWTVFNGASGGTALHAALEAGHKGMAELLIRDLGGCPYVPDTHGRLAVHMMPHEEQQRLEQKLFMAEREKLKNMELRLKADHEKITARTALCIQEDLFESHKKGEGKNVSLPDGHAALLLASRKGLLQLTHLILQEGHFPVDEVLDHTCGTTALHQAASHGQDGCVALLLSAGANPQQRDTYGQTPPHLAAMFGHKSTFELLALQVTQDPPCRAGNTSTQVRENFKVFHNMYYKYKRNLLNPIDRRDPESVIRNLVRSIGLQELQEEAQRVAVDLSKGEALEVKEAVMAEISIIMNKVSAADATYRGDLRLAGSSQDGSKLYAPDEFDINLVIHKDDVGITVSEREKEEAPLKGRLQISVKTDNPHLEGNRFMASLYEEVHRCLAGHTLQDKRLSLVPPGLTSTQVGVGLSLAWQGREYPLLLVGVDLVPVLEVPWLEQVFRPFLTPEDTTTMQLSNAADGTWRCSFALTEAEVLGTLTPAECQVQLMGKSTSFPPQARALDASAQKELFQMVRHTGVEHRGAKRVLFQERPPAVAGAQAVEGGRAWGWPRARPHQGVGGWTGAGPHQGVGGWTGAGPHQGVGGWTGKGPHQGVGGWTGAGPHQGVGGWTGGGPNQGVGGWTGEGPHQGVGGWTGEGPHQGVGGWTGEGPHQGVGGWTGAGPHHGVGGWTGGGPHQGVGGWTGEGPHQGVGGWTGGGSYKGVGG